MKSRAAQSRWRKRNPMTETDPHPAVPQPFSRLDSFVIPLAILIATNVTFFAGIVSFRLRPNMGGRMLPIMGMCFMGILVGGLLFPRLAAWRESAMARGRPGWHRAATAAWSLFAFATILPGTDHYIANEPLRYLGNFAMGTMVAPAYYLFFGRTPRRRQGLWFGLTEAAGILTWFVLGHLAHGMEAMDAPPYHPLLSAVFAVHAAGIAVFSVFCLYALVIRKGSWTETAGTEPGAAADRTRLHTVAAAVFCIAFAAFFLGGMVQARMTPLLISPRQISLNNLLIGIVMGAAAVATGWLLDRGGNRFARRSLDACCWLFLVSPCLTVLDDNPVLYSVLQALTAVGQYGAYVICTVMLAKMAGNAAGAAAAGCTVLFMRVGTVLGFLFWNRVGVANQGVTVFAATAVAGLIFLLSRRVVHGAGPQPAASGEQPAPPPDREEAEAGNALERFLAGVDLTPREAETARLLLQGTTTTDIENKLEISRRAVTKHMTGIFRKFGVANRRALYAAYLATLGEQPGANNGGEAEETSGQPSSASGLGEK